MTLFDARVLAPMWLSAAVASSTDKAMPAMCRTVSIELFEDGVRLTATDSFTLLTAWCPALDIGEDDFDREIDLDHQVPPPLLEEAPLVSAVAIDTHGRAKGLLRHAWHLATQKDAPLIDVRLQLGVIEDLDDEQTLAGMTPAFVTLEIPHKERVKLRTYEGEFPNWRALMSTITQKRTVGVGLTEGRLAQMAKLAKLHEGRPLRFTFGGQTKAVHVKVEGRHVEGIVMPTRTNMETGEPLVDDDDEIPTGDEPDGREGDDV